MAQQSLSEMAELIGKQQQAKRHLAEFDALMESLRPRFARRGDRPLLMITLLDTRHVLVLRKTACSRKCSTVLPSTMPGRGNHLLGQRHCGY